MPYDIRKRGNKFCVVKRDGGKTMGCHTSRAKAARQLSAIMANEHGHHKTAVFKFDGVRHMLLVSTNGYKDREGEYVASTRCAKRSTASGKRTASTATTWSSSGMTAPRLVTLSGPIRKGRSRLKSPANG